jgi:hypothetical protein
LDLKKSDSSQEVVVKNDEKEKNTPKNQLLNNNLNTNPSGDNPKTEMGVVVNENQPKLDLNKYKTAEELNKLKGKDSANITALAAANVEPNALEELLKEKEKEEKSIELKVNMRQSTSAVAPV